MSKVYIKNRYWQIPNDILNNKELSFKAKWLWWYIQSKPDWWDFAVSRIAHDTSDWKDSITAWLKELEDIWLLIRMKYKNEDWKFETNYILHEIANLTVTEKPAPENPESENPEINKERYNKERIINNNINENDILKKSKAGKTIPTVIDKWNKKLITIVNEYENTWEFNLEDFCPANVLSEYTEDSLRRLAQIFLSYYVEHKNKISKWNINSKMRFNKFVISDYHKVLVKKPKWSWLYNVTDEEFLSLLSMWYLKTSQCSFYKDVILPELNTDEKKNIFSAMIRFYNNKNIEAYKSITFKEFATSKWINFN